MDRAEYHKAEIILDSIRTASDNIEYFDKIIAICEDNEKFKKATVFLTDDQGTKQIPINSEELKAAFIIARGNCRDYIIEQRKILNGILAKAEG